MRIGLILDNPRRDLGGITLLAYQLLKQGHEVFVIPMYDQGYDVPLLELDAIVVNYARTSNLEFMRSYKEMGIAIVVLDTEGGVFPEKGDGSPEFWAKRFRSIGAHELIDRYLFWGERTYEAFRQHGGLREDHLIVTGCPRYDFCAEKWRSVLHHSNSGHVLINLNFPSVNPWWGRAEYSEKEQKIIFQSAFKEISNVAKIVNIDIERALPLEHERMRVLNEYVRVIAGIARRNPDQPFIVRPHPFENMEIYRQLFADHPNVMVDSSGEVTHVISKAKFVIHVNCSTSVEARLLGKLPVSLEFLNSEILKANIRLPSQISYIVDNVEELDEVVKDEDRDQRDRLSNTSVHELIAPWFYKCDGNAGERVADVVTELGRRTRESMSRRSYWKSIKSCYTKARFKYLIQGIGVQLGGSFILSRLRMLLRKGRRMKYVTAETVARRIGEFAHCEGQELRVAVGYAAHPMTRLRLATIQVSRSHQ